MCAARRAAADSARIANPTPVRAGSCVYCCRSARVLPLAVLPPGEWNPTIRLEPPSKVPSQLPRRTGSVLTLASLAEGDEEDEGHGSDPALNRTGVFCGGLVADIRRRVPYMLSDYRDALHPQCIASFIFLFLASLAPTITFGGIMGKRLNDWMVRRAIQ